MGQDRHWNCSNATKVHLFSKEDVIHICLPGHFQGKTEHLDVKIVFTFEKCQEYVNSLMKEQKGKRQSLQMQGINDYNFMIFEKNILHAQL